MNLIFNQLKKDLLHTRIILAIWLAMVFLNAAIIGQNVAQGDAQIQSFQQIELFMLLALMSSLLILVLVPLLVHQEPLVNTTAFWLTRPLARTALLTSKAIYLLFLVTLPTLAQSIVLFVNGVSGHDTLLAVPQIVIGELFWVSVVAAFAALTPNYSRFIIIGTILLLGSLLMFTVLGIGMNMLLGFPAYNPNPLRSLMSTRTLMFDLILMGFGWSVIALQYLTRRLTVAITLGVTGIILGLLVEVWWPWDLLKPRIHIAQDDSFKADSITATLSSLYGSGGGTFSGPFGSIELKDIVGTITLNEKPNGYIIQVANVHPLLKSADGEKIPFQEVDQRVGFPENITPESVELGLGGIPVLNMAQPGVSTLSLFGLNGKTYDHYASAPVDCSATIDCVAYKYVVATELPLIKGATFDRGSEHLIITDVLNQPDHVEVSLRERNVRLLFAPRGEDNYFAMQNDFSVRYLLLNRSQHQALIQNQEHIPNLLPDMYNTFLTNKPLHISFGPDKFNIFDKFDYSQLDKEWMDGAVLVRLELVPVATFTLPLVITGLNPDGKLQLPSQQPQQQGTGFRNTINLNQPVH